ncbi:Putative Cytochrome c oxidase subunit IV [Rhizopus microsporus]|nr:Putative Cytochrome c oxidase subunit IV [Rhizopus microsporus]
MLRSAAVRARTGATRMVGRRNASTNVSVQNIETRWKTLSTAEQNTIAKQLEEAQKGDWKVLSLEEKKAAYYIAFGPHGPREPLTKPGHGMKVVGGVSGVIAASAALFYAIRVNGNEIKEMPSLNTYIFYRTRNTQDYQQRMGRSHQRISQEPELQPHHWYLFRRLQRKGLCYQRLINFNIHNPSIQLKRNTRK